MRIKKIFVRNFRKFLQPVTIADLTDGVCVIAGDNEEGKSTIVHAIRSAFHLKYNTTSTQLIQPFNSSTMPEVAVEFDLNGTTYSLRKSFGKKGKAELRSDRAVFADSEAEEKLQELCNAGPKSKDTSIWNVLWVEQGTTFDRFELGESGKRTLQAALEGELGSIVGGDDGQLLLKSVKELYLKWYTNTGKDYKNSEHKVAEEELSAINTALTEAEAQYANLQSLLEQLDTTRSALRAHDEGRTLETLQKALADLQAKKLEVEKHLQAFDQAQQAERVEQVQHTAAATAWKQRSQMAQEVESAAQRLKTLEAQIAELTERHKQASESLHKSQQERDGLEATYEKAVAECESAERLEQLRHMQSQVRELQDHIERAESAQKHCDEIKKEGSQIRVDQAGLDRAREAERAVMRLEAQLQAVATKIELVPSVDGLPATIGGAAVAAGESVLLTEKTSVMLPNWGEVIVTPGGGDLDKLKGNASRARVAFENALKEIGVATLQEAELLFQKKAELGVEWKSWHSEVQKHAPVGVPALQDQLAVLKGQCEQLAESVAEVQSGGEQLSVFSMSESSERLKKVRATRDAAKQALQQMKSKAEQSERDFRESDRQLQMLAAQQKSLQDELARSSEKLNAERAQMADDALFQAVKEAELRLDAAGKKTRELQELLKSLNASSIDSEITLTERKLADAIAELQRLREAQSRLEGALQTLGKTGITEEVEKLRGKREQAETQLARALRKARAIKLLHDTLSEAERNTKQQLAAPLMKRLTPYMQELFGNTDFAFDDANYAVMQLQRNAAEPFQSLSLGTREQISVLTRLAFAETLAESGAPAIVILDDALVYSDEGRFAKMQELLKQAGEKFQIIVMTCRESDYTSMGVPIIKLAECVGQDCFTAVPTVLPLNPVSAPMRRHHTH